MLVNESAGTIPNRTLKCLSYGLPSPTIATNHLISSTTENKLQASVSKRLTWLP